MEKMEKELRASKAVTVVTTGKTALATGQACSIPLLNAMPRNADAIDRPIFVPPPRSSASSAIRQVTPPAPPCPEEPRRDDPAPPGPNSKP